jgi:transposase
LKAAVQAPPTAAGIDLANWNWKVVRQFIEQRTGQRLSRSTCLRSLHRLDFVLKRPKTRLLKADPAKQAAFVEHYVALVREAEATGAKIFFVDEAHFRADGDLRGKWVLKGQAALVDSLCPRWGEQAIYYAAVCLETGEVEVMELEGNSTAQTSTSFLQQLRAKHTGPLIVIWDNAPAHGGEALRQYLRTPNLQLRLERLPGYSPEFNADEAIWDWAREEVTANTCLGTKAKVQAKLGAFFAGLAERTAEVKRRCRTELQARAAALMTALAETLHESPHVDPTCALV